MAVPNFWTEQVCALAPEQVTWFSGLAEALAAALRLCGGGGGAALGSPVAGALRCIWGDYVGAKGLYVSVASMSPSQLDLSCAASPPCAQPPLHPRCARTDSQGEQPPPGPGTAPASAAAAAVAG